MIKKHTKSGYFCSECNTFSNGDYWERGVDKLCRNCKASVDTNKKITENIDVFKRLKDK